MDFLIKHIRLSDNSVNESLMRILRKYGKGG